MRKKYFVLTIVVIMVISCFGAVNTSSVELKENICSCSETVDNSDKIYRPALTEEDIEALQKEIYENGYSFTVRESSATQYSIDQLCGLVEPDEWDDEGDSDITVTGNLPDEFDWRNPNKNYVGRECTTPIRNQGGCGSCWAFGTVAPLESAILIEEGVVTDLAEQWLLSCNTEGYSCARGGWWAHSWHAGTAGKCGGTGAVLEKDCPYTARDDSCGGPYPHIFLIKDWDYIKNSRSIPDVDSIKQAIYDYGPISAAVYVDSSFQSYGSGVFEGPSYGSVNHAVVLVGWNDDPGYWVLRNSWGTGWGEDGYMKIAYGANDIGYSACYVKDYERLVEGEETVNVYIKQITNEGSEYEPIEWPSSNKPEWYYKIQIDELKETNANTKSGNEQFWPWDWVHAYTWNVEQGHVAYVNAPSIDIRIEVWDDDTDIPGDPDDQAAISPKGRAFVGTYDLVTDELTFSDETSVPTDGAYYSIKGTGDDNAKIVFKVTDSYDADEYFAILETDPESEISFGTVKEGSPTETLEIMNTGKNDPRGWAEATLQWTADDDQDWITLSKTSGTISGGNSNSITVTAAADSLSKGDHTGTITVESNAGTKTITVKITKEDKAKIKTVYDYFKLPFLQKFLLNFFQ